MSKTILNKKKSHAFKKDVYLLGKDKNGVAYWLESPTWDCNWYWGFGYVETYTNNNHPEKSRDINSHQHIKNTFCMCQNEYTKEYIHNIYDCPLLHETTFSESEGWELTELFKQFYLLSEMAEFSERGKCYIAPTIVKHGKTKGLSNRINNKMIPKVTNRILEILEPIEYYEIPEVIK